jgi:hypothetical protein
MSGSLQLREYPGEIVRLSCAKCGRALSVGSVENLDQSEKSESTGCHSRHRRNVLTDCNDCGTAGIGFPTAPRAMAKKGVQPIACEETRDDKFRGCDRHHKIVL